MEDGCAYKVEALRLDTVTDVYRMLISIPKKTATINISQKSIGSKTVELFERARAVLKQNSGSRTWAVIENGDLLIMNGAFGKMASLVRKARHTGESHVHG